MRDIRPSPGQRIFIQVGRNWVTLFLFALVVLFSFTGKGFFFPKTLNNILLTSSSALLFAAGEIFVIITGGSTSRWGLCGDSSR